MLYSKLRENKKRLLLILFALVLLLGVVYIYNIYTIRKEYKEQTVMAQEYLREESYKEAIDAYQRALSMKFGDRELLSIGLAQSYVGINNYDKALEVLRYRYEEKKTIAVKEMIEEITVKKSDYTFLQLISYGDAYFANGEYSNAIDEYEKAKLIKGKEDTPYLKIVEANIAMERYDLAREEIQDGLILTESDKLEKKMTSVEFYLNELKYNENILRASEYIYQENYEEAFDKYNEAIWLIPQRDLAYNQMAELYITLKDYDAAKALLQNYLRSNNSETTKEILNRANELIAQKIEREKVLNELYTALSVVHTEEITKIMRDSFFVEVLAESAPLYYNPFGKINLDRGYGIMIIDKYNVYAGGFKDKTKEGIGIQFTLQDQDQQKGWYYYQGEWENDIPNGIGKTGEEVLVKDKDGKQESKVTETSGIFLYGFESGEMHRTFYVNNENTGTVYYRSVNGVPEPYLDANGHEVPAEKPNYYVVGQIYLNNEPTGEYYSIRKGTKFSVNLYKK